MTVDKTKLDELMNKLKEYSLETYQHSVQVAEIAVCIAQNCNFSINDIQTLYYAGLLHDVGKLKIDKEILHSPNKLTDEQFEIMKKHSLYSEEMLKDFPAEIALLALNHHEKLNGNGYPYGKNSNGLSKLDKILAVADITSALTMKRSYKEPMPKDKVVAILNDCASKGEISQKYVDVVVSEYLNVEEAMF